MFWRYCQLINIERYQPSHKGGSEPKSKKYEAVKQPRIFAVRASLPLLVPKAGLALQGAPKGDTAERCASVQRTETTESFVRVLSPALAQKKARASQLGLLVPKAGLVRSEATE